MSRLQVVARAAAATAVIERRILGGNTTLPLPESSGPKLSAGVSVKVAKVQTIERARQAYGISQEKLAAEAGISSRWYRETVQHPSRASDATIANLATALRSLSARRPDDATLTALILATYNGFLLAVCQSSGLRSELVRADDPRVTKSGDPDWLRRSRARQAAVYLTNQALGVRQRPLARALGLTPAAVCQSLRNVEDLRDDPVFDRIIDQASRLITGEGV